MSTNKKKERLKVAKKTKKVVFMGYEMSEREQSELSEMLTEDILERYNNPEYLNQDIADAFAQDKKLKPIIKREVE